MQGKSKGVVTPTNGGNCAVSHFRSAGSDGRRGFPRSASATLLAAALGPIDVSESQTNIHSGNHTRQADANVVKDLKKEYLLRIFGERDAEKRRSLIAKISDRKGIFIDPHGRYVGQTAVNDVAGQPERFTPSAMEYRMGDSATVGVSRLFRYSRQLAILALVLSFAIQAATQKVNSIPVPGTKAFPESITSTSDGALFVGRLGDGGSSRFIGRNTLWRNS